MISVEKDAQKIAVGVKTFIRASFSNEFHTAVGQYVNYLIGLEKLEKERVLFLAVPSHIYKKYFQLKSIKRSFNKLRINIINYNLAFQWKRN